MTIHFAVVNYFGSGSLATLVASLRRQTDSAWALTVVDNSGDPDEAQVITALISGLRARIVVSEWNSGYMNGASQAKPDEDEDWFVVSNADIEYHPEFVANLRATHMSGVGVVAPRIIENGREMNPYMTRRPSLASLKRIEKLFRWPIVARAYILLSHLTSKFRRQHEVPAVAAEIYAGHGSCFALSRYFFQRGGSLDHPVFLFNEELTIAERCRKLGLRVVFEPRLRVQHIGHQATGIWRSRQMLEWQREATTYGVRLIGESVDGAAP